MKTFLLCLFGCCASGLSAAEPAAAPAKPSCCAVEPAAAPLTTRSVYQLDGTWTTDGERVIALRTLRGRPVVLAMFFAQCEYACPVIVNDMKRLRATLPEALRDKAEFVLVTFDTARDTPAALRQFRERMGLDGTWTLLRGEDDAVRELAMVLGVKFKKEARGQFAHSNLLTLLNSEGEIVHQVAGLNGEVSEAARVLAANAAAGSH